mmetsp:Transcript_64846/g.163367  ORF Transcript_64846/g.163367 Transcript_64846/m.163367 type:complete len:466 (+) Transcript_64846:55-1452(+)
MAAFGNTLSTIVQFILMFLWCYMLWKIAVAIKELFAASKHLPLGIPTATLDLMKKSAKVQLEFLDAGRVRSIFQLLDSDHRYSLSMRELQLNPSATQHETVKSFVEGLDDPILNRAMHAEEGPCYDCSAASQDREAFETLDMAHMLDSRVTLEGWSAHMETNRVKIIEHELRGHLIAKRAHWDMEGALDPETGRSQGYRLAVRGARGDDSARGPAKAQGDVMAMPWFNDMLFVAANRHPLLSIVFGTKYSDVTRFDAFLVEVAAFDVGFYSGLMSGATGPLQQFWPEWADVFMPTLMTQVMLVLVVTVPSMISSSVFRHLLGCPIVTARRLEDAKEGCCCSCYNHLVKCIFIVNLMVAPAYVTLMFWLVGFQAAIPYVGAAVLLGVSGRLTAYVLWFLQQTAFWEPILPLGLSEGAWWRQREADPLPPEPQSACKVAWHIFGFGLLFAFYEAFLLRAFLPMLLDA